MIRTAPLHSTWQSQRHSGYDPFWDINGAKYDEMYKKKVIAHNLKASKKQIMDDLNGFMSPLQGKIMKELLVHADEPDVHIEHLNDDIVSLMKPEKKKAAGAIREVTTWVPPTHRQSYP